MGVYSGSRPYGEIFTINTGGIDAIAKQVYREQQIREQQKMQQDKALDDEFAKNVAGVKSVDIPEITAAYNKFKQAHIALQKKGRKATPQDQMNVMIEKANTFQAINGSKEDKEYLIGRAKEGKGNKRYDPHYQVKITEKLNTPTSKRQRDLDDDDLLAKYAMPDINKEILTATKRDDGADFELLVGVDEKDPLKDKYEEYKRINPPNIFYNKLFTGLGTRADNENFTRFVLDNTTDDEKQKLRTAYELKIADPNFIKLYGKTEPFPASAGNTELGQATALKTMEAVVNLPIEKIKDKSVLNADRDKLRGVADKIDAEKRANAEYDRRAEANLKRSLIKIAANKQNPSGGVQESGNSFDEFGGVTPIYIEIPNEGGFGSVTGKIDKGVVFDKDGNLFTGEVEVGKKDIPVNVATSLAAGKIPIPAKVPLVVKDGIIVGIKTPNGIVDREKGILNLQKKANTEPIKGDQPKFGKTTKEVEQPAPKKETPKSNKKQVPGWNN